MSYQAIDHCIPGPNVPQLDLGHALYRSCDCHMTCRQCDCMEKCAYNIQTGTLHDEYLLQGGPPMFECNQYCTCPYECINRTSQKKKAELDTLISVKDCLGKGEGLFARTKIPKGTFIGEYMGEVIKVTTATERLSHLSPNDSCYIVQYREHDMSSDVTMTTCIDARNYGNHTRFANHSCCPNMLMLPVRRSSIVPHLCLFTTELVTEGQELTFSYSGGETVTVGNKPCLCGSDNCKGYLPLQI